MSLAELFYLKNPRRTELFHRNSSRRRPKRCKPLFETLEPRLLLSATLAYPAMVGEAAITDVTLVAENNGGTPTLKLYETGTANEVASVALDDGGDWDVDIYRDDFGGGDTVLDLAGDTLRIDLDSFDLTELETFLTGLDGILDIDFNGGKDISMFADVIPGIANDQVVLEGAGATTIPFSLRVHSTSDILVTAGTVGGAGITFDGTDPANLTLESDSKVEFTGAKLAADDITLKAGKSKSVTGEADSLDFLQLPSATIALTDSELTGANIVIEAKAELDVTINAADAFDGAIQFAELLLIADAGVTVDNTDITATGTLDIDAITDIDATLTKKPDEATEEDGETEEENTSTDAAVAVAFVMSDTTMQIIGGSQLTATGAADIHATHTLDLDTTADGTLGGSSSGGAVVAVSIVLGNTELLVENSTIDASAITLEASTDRSVDTMAKAAAKGATEGSDSQESQQRMDNPDGDDATDDDAATDEGELEFAATVAVTVVTGHTWAEIADATMISDGAVGVTASGTYDVSTTGDGSFTDETAPGVGLGVAIGVHVIEAKAWIEGTTSLDAPSGATVQAIMPASTFDVLAKSGASGDDSGLTFAGALAINLTIADVHAQVAAGAALSLEHSDITVQTQSTTDSTSKAEASAGGGDESTGVGASIALLIVDNDTKATIGSGATLTDAEDVHLSSTADHGVVTDAKGGSEGGTAITPVVAISIVTLDTTSAIEGTTLQPALVTEGELLVDADGTSSVETKAEGRATGSDTAVGAALAFTWAQDTVAAQTTRSVTSGGQTRFKAKGRAVSTSEAIAAAQGAEGDSESTSTAQEKSDSQRTFGNQQTSRGAAGGKTADGSGTENKATAQDSENQNVSVAAAIAVNIATSTARAEIADGVTIDSDGLLTVQASQNADSTATANADVNDAGTGVAAAVAVNVAIVTNSARIGDATVLADGVSVKAEMTDVGSETTDEHASKAEATSGSGSSDVGIAGSVAINYVDVDTDAVIESGASLDLSDGGDGGSVIGGVALVATSVTDNTAKALPKEDADGEGGSDSAGVGASFALNLILNDTTAEIQDGVVLTGTPDSLSAQATGTHDTTTEAKNGAKGDTGVGAAVAVVISESHTTARVGTGATVMLGSGDSTISAHHDHTFVTNVSSEAEGSDAAVGASVGVVIAVDSATATLARSLDATSADIAIEAVSGIASTLDVQASAGGSDESDDNADTKSNSAANNNNVTSNAGAQSTPSASSETSSASSTSESQSGSSGGSVGVAAAVGVTYIGFQNTAQVTNGADINTTGEVSISAQLEVDATSKALGVAVTLEDSNMIGAAVGVSVVEADNKALVFGGSTIEGDGITVEAVTTGSGKNEFIVWGAAAGGGTGDVGVAGSVGVNVVVMTTEASVADTAHLLSTGDLHVTAENEMVLQTIAAGVGFSDGTSVGAAVAVTVVDTETNAFILGDADASDAMAISATTTMAPPPILDLPDNDVIDDPSIAISSAALAGGASSGGVGIAGAVSVTVYEVDTRAYIGANAQINQDGTILPAVQSVSVTATSTTDMTNAAGALGISTDSAGVGAGLDVSVITKHTEAYIANGADVDSAGGVTVDAQSSEDIISIAANAGVGDSVGVAGSASVQVITTETRAYIGSSATVDAGNVTLSADGTLVATMVAGSIGGGSSAGVGAAATVLVHTDTVEAYIGNSATVTSDGSAGVAISATSSEELITIAAAGGFASTAGVAGSAVVNVLDETTTAWVGRSANVTSDNGGSLGAPDLQLHAQDDTTIISVAGNLAAGGTAGVGLGADVAVIDKHTKAYIDSGVIADVEGDIGVAAGSSEDITSVAAGLSASGTVSVALDASVHVLTIETKAFIGDEPGGLASAGPGDVHAGGNVSVTADEVTEIDKIVGVLAVSGTAGVGAAGAVTVIDKTTEAFIGAGAQVTADGNTSDMLVATGGFEVTLDGGAATFDPNDAGDEGIHADSLSSDPDSSSLRGQGEVNTPTIDAVDADQQGGNDASDPALSGALVRSAATRDGFRGLNVSATNRDDIEAFTISVAGGTAGVAISAGVNIVTNTTQAYIGGGAVIDAEAVNVAAGNDFYHLAVAGTLGVGVVGVSPAADVTVLSNTTLATIHNSASVTADDDVRIEAHATEHLLQIAFGIGGGVVGIGGAVGVFVMNNTTTSSIGDATVNAGGDVLVKATDDTHLTMVSGALAGGFVGVGASVGVMVVNKDTSAFVADGAVINADGAGTGLTALTGTLIGGDAADGFTTGTVHGLIVEAASSEEVLHLVIAAGAGFVGVAGAVAVTVIDSDTNAWIGNADINQGGSPDGNQSVYVNAANMARLTTLVVGAAGGFVGVGGAVDVGVVKNDTKAEIRTGAVVDAFNDVEVNALGIHEVDGFTFSGAGGVVGLTAAVSVWSVGTPIQKNYSDSEGNPGTATEGENGAADSDATGQAASSHGEVSGLLTGFENDGSGNANTSQNRVSSATGSASGTLSSSAPSQTSLNASINDATPSNGTVAAIAAGANVGAGDDINVTAREDTEISLIVGGVAGGLVGVGASIAVLTTGLNASATAGGTLNAGDDINLVASLDEDIGVVSLAGAAGFVGLGAAVVVINDHSTVAAGIANNAVINNADAIAISATGNQTLHGLTGQISAGAVGAGATFVMIDVDNDSATDTRAFVGSNVDIGQGGTVGSLSVTASSTISAHAENYALSAGIGAFSLNVAIVGVTPEVEATIGANAEITVTGGVSVSATGTPSAHAETFGISAGGLAVGASLADAESSAVITASVAGTITASSLSVNATQAVPGGGYNALAETTGSAGALIGIDATISNATNNGIVQSFVAAGSTLTITNATTVAATNNSRQKADANSNVGGLIAAGISASDASSNTTTEAYLGSNVKLTGKSLAVTAIGTDDNFADTVAGSAGAIAVSSATAETHNTSTTRAEIENRTGGASRNINLTSGAGTLDIKAEHTSKFNSRTIALAGGLFAGLGADTENFVTSNVTAAVGASVIVTAKDIDIEAINHVNKQLLGTPNIIGAAGGFIAGGGADSDTLIALTTIVDIGAGASLTLVGSVINPGDFILKSLNDIVAKDKVAFTAGGLAAGLSADSRVETTTDLSRVQIGSGAVLTSNVGDIDIFARGQGDVQALVEAEAYGVGTYTAADAVAKVYPHNEIEVGTDATIHAKGDLSLYAGTDRNFVRDQYTIDARSDTFAGSAIPIDDVNSTTVKITFNTIIINAGALLETAGMARLQAEKEGFADLSGSAKATSWVSEVQDWLNGAAAALMNDATIFQEGHGFIQMDGTVRTGIERHKELILTGWNNATGTITSYTQQGGVTFTSGPELVESGLVQELAAAQEQLNLYGDSNPTLREFYEGEIARIKAEMEAQGLTDPDSPVAISQYAIHVRVDPIVAEAGRIDVRADVLHGTGLFDAPSDASVNIENHTPAFLIIEGIEIPDTNGGLYLNGVPVTTNGAIDASNDDLAAEDNSRTGPGDAFIDTNPPFGMVPSFSALPNPVTSDPTIWVENDFVAGHVSPTETYPWPSIVVEGTVSNLSGLVHLETLPAGEGSIIITATVEAETLEIIAGGTVFVDLGDIPNSKFNVGAEPFTQWDPITMGTVPGDSSGTLYEGLGRATDTNDDGIDDADMSDINDLLDDPPSPPGIIGDRVYITAEYINVDGLIQSGKDTYNLTLGTNTINEINTLGAATGWVPLTNLDVAGGDFVVKYDTATGQIIIDDVNTKAGYVDLTGHVLNTGNGMIKVLGGYAHVNIDNNTGHDLVLYRIDESQPGDGTLIIKDKAKDAPGSIFTTLYQQTAGGPVSKTEDNGSGPVANGDTTHYTPEDGFRYGWSIGVETFTRKYYHHDTSAWLGIDWLSADPATIEWDTTEVLDVPHILDDGPYYFKDASITAAYTYEPTHTLQDTNEDGVVNDDDNKLYIIDDHVDSTWYGEKTYHNEVKWERRDLHVFTHTIEADRPIAVEFIGDTEGMIDVDSNAGVILRGSLLNPSGTTKITADGAIRQEGDEALVTGKRIELSGSSIGTGQTPIDTNVSGVAGASLKATTGGGEIHINEIFGDLPIDQVVSAQNILGSGGKVSLTSQGGMSVASSYTGRVEGGAITLDANGGGIGSLSAPIKLDAGVFQWDKLNVDAVGSVYLEEQDGNLVIESITATDDVHLTLLSGGIVDGNEAETRDERTYEQLKNGVWHDLALTGADALNKVEQAKLDLAANREQEYATYWTYRMGQPHDPIAVIETSGLATGVTYYAIVDGDHVRLAASASDAMNGTAIDIDAAGAAGTGHALSVAGMDFDAQAAVNGALDTLTLTDHGFGDGDAVTYDAMGGPDDIGLTQGVTYYVSVVDANTIKFKEQPGDLTFADLAPTAAPATQALYRQRVFDESADVDSAANFIDLGPGHGIETGDAVVYSIGTGDTALQQRVVGSLETSETYYVIVVDADTIKLAAAPGGPALDLDADAATGAQHALGDLLFDPATEVNSATNEITIASHGLGADDPVVYNSLVYDNTHTVALSAAEEAFYRNELGYNDAQIAALEASRTEQYHTLHGQVGGYTEFFEPSFTYTLTTAEENLIESRIHVYTEDELLYTISAGLLKDIADTTVTIEEANITADNVVLVTSGGVGNATDVLELDVSGGALTLTTDERVALAAAERADVAYLGPSVSATVNIDAGARTFTRGSGSWLDDGFEHDMRIHVEGSAVNDTGVGEYYLVDTVTDTVLTLTSSAVLTTESGVSLTVTPEVNDPTAPGVDIDTIVIDQREDVDVEIVGEVNVDAHDSVYLGSEAHDINIVLVQTDPTDDVRIKTGQGITNAAGPSATNIIGGDTILEAALGSVGTAANPINTDLGATATITGRAKNNIYIVEKVGDMNLEFMFAETGGVYLTADDDLLDALDTDFTNIAANHVELTANNGQIGEAGDYVDIDVAGTGTIVADAHDSIWISETFGNMNVEHVQSTHGDVDLKALISILDALNSPLPEIIGNSITLTAVIGGIGVSGNDVDIDSAYSGPGVLTSSSELANTYIIETDGSGPTVDDLSLNTVSTGTGFTAFITAPEGSILNSNVSPHNVVSGRAYLVALNDIGADGNALTTEIGNLEGKSILGSTWIVNTGGLETGGVVDSGDPGMVAGGDITIDADSPIDVIENIVSDNVTLNAVDDSADDHIVVHSGFRIETATYNFTTKTWERTAGTIELNAGDDFHLEGGAQLLTLGNVIINGDAGDNDPGLGSTIDIDGLIETGVLTISGAGDEDTVLLDDGDVTASGFIEIHGTGGDDTILITGTLTAPEIRVYGEGGDDVITFDVDYPTHALTGHVEVFGGAGQDLITVNRLHTRASTFDIDGQGGTDDVIINVRSGQTDYVVNVYDSGAPDDGADTLTINGTDVGDAINVSGADLFLSRANFVAYLNPIGGVASDLHPEVERINYNENINGRLVINGESGDDSFYSDDNSAITTLDGGAGNDYFQIGQIFGLDRVVPQVALGDEIQTLETTVGFLSRGISFSTVVFGGDGADEFNVYSNKALLKLFGEDGNDVFTIRAFVLTEGGIASDDSELHGGEGDDLIQYNINAPVSIDGGAGADTVVIIGTEIDDNFVIKEDGVMGAGLNVQFTAVEKLEVDGLEGNDHFFVLSTSPDLVTTVIGGLGSDTIDVGGDVTEDIIALAVEGRTGFINHSVESADPAYDGIFAEGVQLHVADENTGTVIVTPSGDMTVVEENGDLALGATETDTYTVKLAVPPPDTATTAYITVSAAQSSYKDRNNGGKALQVSLDGVAFVDALTLTFDSTVAGTIDVTAWAKEHTIYVRGTFDAAEEGERTVVISHSIRSDNEDFNHLSIANVEVKVIDDDKPGLIIGETDLKTRVEEGSPAGDTYAISLTKPPDPGETVTVTLELDSIAAAQLSISDPALTGRFDADTMELTFDSSNWSTPFLLQVNAVDDGVPENRLRGVINHAVSSTGGEFDAVLETPEIKVDIRDNDAAGVVVTQTNGSTLVVEGTPDTYDLVLTKAPSAPVTVKILTDGQTIVSADNLLDTRFGTVDGAPAVTFDGTNWNVAFTVKVEVDPAADPVSPVVQTFPAQPHTLTEIRGPLIVEGSVIPGRDRSLKQAVILPAETDGPLPVLSIEVDESVQTDTLNIFDDGSVFNEIGLHRNPVHQSGLDAVYLDPTDPQPVELSDFGNVSGLDMGGDLTIDFGTPEVPDERTFDGGVTYHGVEVVDILLGQGNDQFTVEATVDGTITVVQGGGNAAIAPLISTPYGDVAGDYIVVNGGGGSGAPLIVFGDTSQDGRFYDSTTEAITGRARAFVDHGDDVIDAQLATESLALSGGRGDDTIYGSQAGDHIAGGSGDDTIFGEAGVDHVYGDSGFNIDLSTRIDLAAADPDFDVLAVATAPDAGDYADTRDGLAAGADELHGGADDDLIFGDHGVIEQAAGTERLLTTGSVVQLYTVEVANGADDVIYGDSGDGDDLIMGGAGSDAIYGGAGIDVIFGDHGVVSALSGNNQVVTYAPETAPWFEGYFYTATETLNVPVGAADLIYGGDGGDYILGEHETDTIFGGAGDDDIYGGHNVAAGYDTGDMIDGGAGNDVIAGDNASIQRTGGIADPRFRTLAGTLIYDDTLSVGTTALVDGEFRANRDLIQTRTVILFDHMSNAPVDGTFGNDLVAGGADNDVVFGQLGNDTLHGDGQITGPFTLETLTTSIPGADVGGDDYVEGNGGDDSIYGGLGQDDLIGGSSTLFGLGASPSLRPDGADLIFGGNGDLAGRNDAGDLSAEGHARDSDMILGDNGNIFRLVGTNGTDSGAYLTFNYDIYSLLRIIPRAAQLLDYTPGGMDYAAAQAVNDIGAGDQIHGEAGDDFIYGQGGGDAIYGDAQNDNIVGGYGADWISGGTGEDGVLGDDGRLYASRNSTAYGEPLYGIAAIPGGEINKIIQNPNAAAFAITNVAGALKYTANLAPDNLDPSGVAPYTTMPRPLYANDMIFGGLGSDSIHGGAGEDAISGGEALELSYVTQYDQNGVRIGGPIQSDFFHPVNPGNVLGYDPVTTKFALYDANDPLRKILFTATGTLSKTGSGLDWSLNFSETDGPIDTTWIVGTSYPGVNTDGDDRIFGDLGHDWLVGGTGRDTLWAGWGDDYVQADDKLSTAGGLNNAPDTNPSWEDFTYGGAGRDVMVINTGGDRAIDWTGEFNSFIVPYNPFGEPQVSRYLQPAHEAFMYELSKSQGADQTLGAQYGGDPARNGEPFGELGMVRQHDAAWGDQTGGPRDPQGPNAKAKQDVRPSAGVQPLYETAAGGQTTGAANLLTEAQLGTVAAQARQLWVNDLGAGDARLAALSGANVMVGNLPDGRLGVTLGNQIFIDSDASGYGWNLDASTLSSSWSNQGMNLLSVVAHEMGHVLGLEHSAHQGNLMAPTLDAGARFLSFAGQTPSQGSQSAQSGFGSAVPGFWFNNTPSSWFTPSLAAAGQATPVVSWDGGSAEGSETWQGSSTRQKSWVKGFLSGESHDEAHKLDDLIVTL